MKRYFDSKGLTLVEVLISLTITGVLLSGLVMLLKQTLHFRGTANAMAQTKKIETALDTTYRENIAYVEQNCYGWTDASCNTLTLVPTVNGADSTQLFLNTSSANVTGAWQNAGCALTGTAPSYTVRCADGFGSYYTFAVTNPHSANTFYVNGYNRTPYSIIITSGGSANVTDTWSSGYLDGEYQSYSQKKLLTVAGSLKSYHMSRLTNEVVVNTCKAGAGGLESYDDVIVPWYFQSTGNSPSLACSGVESGNCGCSGFVAAIWPASGSGWNRINSSAKFSTVLTNIGLSSLYRVDGFGNPIQIWMTVNSAGTLQGEPPRPAPSYSGTWAVSPPYHGVVGVYSAGAWLYSQPLVYAQ
ncbi:MAG: type II secretion system protein [Thermodesulfovibrionales bacterium]